MALNMHIKLFELGIIVWMYLKILDKCEETQDSIYWASSKKNLILLQEKISWCICIRWMCYLVTMEYYVYNIRKVVIYYMSWSKTLHYSFGLVRSCFCGCCFDGLPTLVRGCSTRTSCQCVWWTQKLILLSSTAQRQLFFSPETYRARKIYG